jgi:MtN3 and saliva related transmembrane protein
LRAKHAYSAGDGTNRFQRRRKANEQVMDQAYVTAMGAAAATLTTVCWLPQALHVIRTRDTAAISLLTYSVFAVGLVLWLCYGIELGSWPIIGSNIVTLVPVIAIIVLKLRHG